MMTGVQTANTSRARRDRNLRQIAANDAAHSWRSGDSAERVAYADLEFMADAAVSLAEPEIADDEQRAACDVYRRAFWNEWERLARAAA